ncbi:cation:proton antiporter [Thermosulfurimonas dismutans]|uniref:Sodium/hydrogen exchanger n=1 Tax=Thermosulfurimonas dismutans TaxID=999894 RepID=A0A179D732_9BACT|nr:cation:proton antiporter [Thermosulfurimonas dismutans]OAQ21847.1 sodium/hydrogen exchanger [Thermosulfurimonas dismutans]
MALLQEIVLILCSAALTGLLAHHLRIPTLIGFILAGVLIGPSGLALIQNLEEIHLWAEIGVILLLFTIGIEFSPAQLSRLKRIALLGGTFQILATALTVTLLLQVLAGLTLGRSIFWGLVVALSSTAVVLSLLQDRHELETPQGQIAMGILLFQDLMVVPMLMAIPLLNPDVSGETQSWPFLFLKSAGAFVALYIAGTKLVPWIMDQVALTRNRELFLLIVIALCLGISLITYKAGLSLSMGAFLAGFLLSRSPYHAQIVAEILPFKDLLVCVFFISVGMLLSPETLWQQPLKVLGLTSGIIVLKGLIALGAVLLLRYPFKIALTSGLLLFQVGEFSFVLAQEGLKYQLLSPEEHRIFIAATLFSILFTPLSYNFLIRFGGRFWGAIAKPSASDKFFKDHLVIIGFGVIGRTLALAAKRASLPFVVIELNPLTVKREKLKGTPIVFGDASNAYILQEAGLEMARVVAVTIPDAKTARAVVALVRRINPKVYLIARTRFATEIEVLKNLGADEVVAEELVASTEIFRRVMTRYGLPSDFIQKLLDQTWPS